MSNAQRIDVHQHVIPQVYLDSLTSRGMGAWAPQSWSPAGAVTMMDNNWIATGILSLSAPGCHFGDDAEALKLATAINEEQAELVKDRPDRFGMFAAVPLPDVDGALEAIAYAYDELSTDGVVLLANNRGTYLGDPAFEPVMAELNERNAVIFVHPTAPPGPSASGVHPAIVDFLFDTTRAAVSLVIHGVTKRYPNLQIILAHAGGFLPYAAYRVATVGQMSTPGVDRDSLLSDLGDFYFDTALSSSPVALPSLLAFARPGHVLFGSDSPYAREAEVTYFTEHLDTYQGLDAAGREAINRTSAEALFPRLASSAPPVG